MRKFAFMTRQNWTRWIFIFGVLTGLFFSGGEGIQLLPFSIAEGNSSKNTSSILQKNLKAYAFSVHNSSNHSPLHKSKFQKHTNQFLPLEHLNFDWSSNRANLWLQLARKCREANVSHTSAVLNSQSDRAPPTV